MMDSNLERTRETVAEHADMALDCWRRAADFLAAALDAVEAGQALAQQAYDARRDYVESMKANGATAGECLDVTRSMPIPSMPERLRKLNRGARGIETLRAELGLVEESAA